MLEHGYRFAVGLEAVMERIAGAVYTLASAVGSVSEGTRKFFSHGTSPVEEVLLEEMARRDLDTPGWDRSVRVTGARNALNGNMSYRAVAQIFGQDIAMEAMSANQKGLKLQGAHLSSASSASHWHEPA